MQNTLCCGNWFAPPTLRLIEASYLLSRKGWDHMPKSRPSIPLSQTSIEHKPRYYTATLLKTIVIDPLRVCNIIICLDSKVCSKLGLKTR